MAEIGYYKTKVMNPTSGEMMYGVRLVPYTVMSADEIVAHACRSANIKRQDMAVGFSALCQAIQDFVMQGHSVSLDGLGNFRVSAKSGVWDSETNKWVSAGKDSKEEVTTKDIKGVYVRFRPCTALRTELNNAKLFDVGNTAFGAAKGGLKKDGESAGDENTENTEG
jgi:nucleoid DNA-binding protein